MGKCPADNPSGKPNLQAIVSFCLKVEVLIQDLIGLADSENNEKYDAYNSSIRDDIQNLFRIRDIMNIRALTITVKVGLEEHIKYVMDYRVRAQSIVNSKK